MGPIAWLGLGGVLVIGGTGLLQLRLDHELEQALRARHPDLWAELSSRPFSRWRIVNQRLGTLNDSGMGRLVRRRHTAIIVGNLTWLALLAMTLWSGTR